MKKTILLLISSVLFSLFFYNQQIGLNYSLFSLIVIVLIGLIYPSRFTKKTIPYVLGFVIAGVSVFVYSNPLSIVAYFLSFFIFLGAIYEVKSSLFVKLINGLYTSVAGIFELQYQRLNQKTTSPIKNYPDVKYWLKIIGIPLAVFILFSALYYHASPNFAVLIDKADLSFINGQWILFTLFGFGIILNFTSLIPVDQLTSLDLKSSNNLVKSDIKPQTEHQLIQERQQGSVLIGLLVLLIAIFIITDFIALFNQNAYSATALSKSVHSGIYALITSILLAIVIILYFFRGNLNFYKNIKSLKLLTIIWIALNLVIILLTAFKNYNYVINYGLTYKRIGVFIYLLLASIGLITTLLKVTLKYNLWYLSRVNIATGFTILLICCTFNWDRQISNFNINHAEQTDIQYLLDLSDNNAFYLKSQIDKFPKEIQGQINRRFVDYSKKLATNNWQELVYDNFKNYDE